MATSGVGFRWLDLLEKEFDKACVELDTSLAELESEEPDVVFSSRQKIATLSSCFAQLTHKALTIFQNSAKLDAELVDIRAELIQLRAAGQKCGDITANISQSARARAEAAQLARENAALRETVLALHSELFGARLATKYLDKELAGRIQQLQLLGSDMRAELRDSLWAQVEAEILLQRHKTLVRVCRGLAPRAPRPPASHAPPAPRTVRVRRSPHLGLGISVTGGREHGVPILISELEAGGPAALTGELYVGDAILAINDLDLTQACHKEAVQALQSVKGDCALCVQFIATDDDDRLSEDNYRFPLYPEDGEGFEEPDASGATPTAPRTPEYNHNDNSASECDEDNSYAREPVYDPHRVCLHDGVRDSVPLYEPERRTYDRNENGPFNKYGTRDVNGPYDKAYEPRDVNGPYDKAYEPRDVNGPYDKAYELRDVNGPYDKSYEPREVNGPYDNSYGLKNENGSYDKYGHKDENGPYDKSHESKSKDGNGPYVQERAAESITHYADYNNINNLSILDMDDDSIKIEARLEMSGSTSARSTPVHARNSLKKKRKPQDWRTKGAYCAVSDAQSSDDLPTNDTKEAPPSGYLPISIPSPAHETSCAVTAPVTSSVTSNVTSTVTSNVTSTVTLTGVTSSVPADMPPCVTSKVTSAVMSTITVPSSASVLPKSKANGDSRSKKDTKGFRIGSARRVTEPARERRAPRLLPGRGDPDFGTPV